MSETVKYLLERYGLPTLVACAAMWVLRNDVLLPLVDQHSQFLRTIGDSQKEIAQAVQEQARILYALQKEPKNGLAGQ
jgi:hypothetical protein